MHGRVVCSNHVDEVEQWFNSFESKVTLAFDGEFMFHDSLAKNVMVLAQFTGGMGSSTTTLITNCIGHPSVLQRLFSPETVLVGKDLRGDWDALAAAVHLSGVSEVTLLEGKAYTTESLLQAGCEAAGWHDVTELLPLHRVDASTESLARFVLGKSAGWKRTVNHATRPPTWVDLTALSTSEIHYAACDACFVWDLMVGVREQIEALGGHFPWHQLPR